MKQVIRLMLMIALGCTLSWNSVAQTVRSSTVEVRRCYASYGADSMRVLQSHLPYTWHGVTFSKSETKVAILTNHYGCDSIVTLKVETVQPGSVHAFSVSDSTKVYISQGNLQYRGSADGSGIDLTHPIGWTPSDGDYTLYWTCLGEFRFSPQQWEIVGWAADNMSTPVAPVAMPYAFAQGWAKWAGSDYYLQYAGTVFGVYNSTQWVDLFGPRRDNILSYSSFENVEFSWPVKHGISNGGNQPGIWRVPTSSEWEYLRNGRANALQRRTNATVNNMAGTILLPDEWTLPEGCQIVFNVTDFAINTYKSGAAQNDWDKMEMAGAVFLPAVYYASSGGDGGTPGYSIGIHEGVYATNPCTITGTIGFKVNVRLVRDAK